MLEQITRNRTRLIGTDPTGCGEKESVSSGDSYRPFQNRESELSLYAHRSIRSIFTRARVSNLAFVSLPTLLHSCLTPTDETHYSTLQKQAFYRIPMSQCQELMMQPIKFCFSSSVITIGLVHKTNCENFVERKNLQEEGTKNEKRNNGDWKK